ncbi:MULTISPECIES: hypothetical protein [unclassified Arthrobacter]|nr:MULTISPECIES: hypothetical protein [unclassified Arthrobacter]MDP9989241.1 hypothetical protein [Arthrobacter oryzae]
MIGRRTKCTGPPSNLQSGALVAVSADGQSLVVEAGTVPLAA